MPSLKFELSNKCVLFFLGVRPAYILLSIFSFSAFSENNVSVGILEYQPYSNAEFSDLGILTELYLASFHAKGVDAKNEVLPSQRTIEMFHNLTIDAHAPGQMHLHQNENVESIDIVYGSLFFAYYKKKLSKKDIYRVNNYTNLSYINDLKVVAIRNSASLDVLRKHNFEIVELESIAQSLNFLESGRTDLVVIIDISGLMVIGETYDFDIGKDFDFSKETVIPSFPMGIAFNRKNPRFDFLTKTFKEGLELIKSNGTYMKVLESYYGKANVPKAALLSDMKKHGVDKINLFKFLQQKRGPNGKIKEAQ